MDCAIMSTPPTTTAHLTPMPESDGTARLRLADAMMPAGERCGRPMHACIALRSNACKHPRKMALINPRNSGRGKASDKLLQKSKGKALQQSNRFKRSKEKRQYRLEEERRKRLSARRLLLKTGKSLKEREIFYHARATCGIDRSTSSVGAVILGRARITERARLRRALRTGLRSAAPARAWATRRARTAPAMEKAKQPNVATACEAVAMVPPTNPHPHPYRT
eukprot:2207803-Pleurochrysis_carterae.AAC.1